MHRQRTFGRIVALALLAGGCPYLVFAEPDMTMATYLDRLMAAESGGRDGARNPRSTAVGPFQFIETTFIAVAGRHFAAETAGLDTARLLALRTDRAFARRAAEAFTRDNAAHLSASGVNASFPHLRLAHLVGPTAAARLLQLPPSAPVAPVLGAGAMRANPFLAGMTVAGLVARSARDLAVRPETASGVAAAPGSAPPPRAAIAVRCNLDLASCRRWLVLAERRGTGGTRARVARLAR